MVTWRAARDCHQIKRRLGLTIRNAGASKTSVVPITVTEAQ